MSKRFKWLPEEDLPKGARVIQAQKKIVRFDYEPPDHPLISGTEYPVHQWFYLIDTEESK